MALKLSDAVYFMYKSRAFKLKSANKLVKPGTERTRSTSITLKRKAYAQKIMKNFNIIYENL